MGGGYEKIRRHLHVPLPTIDFEDFSSDDQYELLKLVDSNTTVCVGGWGFRVHELTKKYQDLFKTEYTLKQQFYINNELYSKYLDLKKTGKTLIGVHVRRGDYKDWEDGKFFFNDDIYCSYMLRMKELLGNDVHFFIFANEESLNLNDSLAACCTFSKEDWFIDQYIMSQCDYLIGPPSTFTLWASYIGKAKYFHIGGDLEFSLSNFTSCIG